VLRLVHFLVAFGFYQSTEDIMKLLEPSPSVQSVVWQYNEFGDKLRDIEKPEVM
jgi:hypothetical protein